MIQTTNVTNKWNTLRHLLTNHGLSWVVARFIYEAQIRSGFQGRRFRPRPWADNELGHWLHPGIPADPVGYATYRQQHCPPFFFEPADQPIYAELLGKVLGEAGRQALLEEAEQIKQGNFRYFFAQSGQLGFPPDWHCNPFTGQRTSPTAHWSQIPMFSPETGDLKFIWEPGRFAAAYVLARAYWVSGNDVYAETFWQLVESWANANPPNQGAHWRCGQETSLRLMAWCFAFYAFADSPATTPDRLALLVGIIAVQADRVAGDHIYARLQRNNHAISEGVGLWTIGILFPELKMAAKWREVGRQILEEEALRQIYDDGAYIQHATNYHRLMLHDYMWAIRLGELNGYELSSALRGRVRQAGEFLYQLQDEASGYVPNYGNNDGALILPLNSCDYKNFRPVLGAIYYLFDRRRLYQPGPWDEDLVWLFGPTALDQEYANVEKRSLQASTGGYYTLRGRNSWGLIRCTTYQDRPSQADMLHLDVWRKGVNVACDPGTYLYYAEPPWDNSLVSTLVHNTVSVDGVDQMARGPRFLWLTWIKSQVLHHRVSEHGLLGYFEGAHDGYIRLPQPVTHRRAVLRADEDIWIVVDDLTGQGEHDFRLHWLLANYPLEVDTDHQRLVLTIGEDSYGLSIDACLPSEPVSVEFDVLHGTTDSVPRGWQSTYYGVCQPTLSVVLSVRASTPCRLVSVFAPETPPRTQRKSPPNGFPAVRYGDRHLSVSAEQIQLANDNLRLTANLFAPDAASIFQDVLLDKATGQEHLTIC